MDNLWIIYISGWWLTKPLWKISSSIGMIIPNIRKSKTCSKPPTSYNILQHMHITGNGQDSQDMYHWQNDVFLFLPKIMEMWCMSWCHRVRVVWDLLAGGQVWSSVWVGFKLRSYELNDRIWKANNSAGNWGSFKYIQYVVICSHIHSQNDLGSHHATQYHSMKYRTEECAPFSTQPQAKHRNIIYIYIYTSCSNVYIYIYCTYIPSGYLT